jgi:hypothetical protein
VSVPVVVDQSLSWWRQRSALAAMSWMICLGSACTKANPGYTESHADASAADQGPGPDTGVDLAFDAERSEVGKELDAQVGQDVVEDGGEDPLPSPIDGRPADVTADVLADVAADVAVDVTADVSDLSSHLIGYWKLDETDGITAADASGRGHTGKLEGFEPSPTWVRAGQRDGGLSVSAATPERGVRVDLTPAISDLRRFTVAAWVRRDVTGPRFRSVISRQIDGAEYEIFNLCFVDDMLTLYLPRVNTTIPYLVRDPAPTAVQQWVHVAGTYDGAVARIYRGGVSVGSVSYTQTFPISTQPLYLGTNKNATSAHQPLAGTLDEVLLYDDALPAEAIAALARGEVPPL